MFIKAKHRLNKNEYCYVNTDYITEIYPPTDNKCGTVYLVNQNYSLDIDKEEFEKILKNDFKAESYDDGR